MLRLHEFPYVANKECGRASSIASIAWFVCRAFTIGLSFHSFLVHTVMIR